MAEQLGVLIVEDDTQQVRILQAVLKQLEVELRVAETGRLALQMILDHPPEILLLDMRLPDMMGMEVLKEVSSRGTPMTVIVMTAHGSVDLAVDAMREGAYDFLTKPLDFERLKVMVRNALERHRIIQELDSYKNQYDRVRFRGLIGSSPAMQRLYRQIRSLGAGSSPVLILGEEGTEREACARAIHDESSRSTRPFVSLRAGSLTPNEFAQILQTNVGATVYLEALSQLPTDVHEHIKEALEKSAVRLLAGDTPDLKDRVNSGAFPASIHDALDVATLFVPRLTERGEDVLDMAEHLVASLSRELGRSFTDISDEVQIALVNYTWPGNRMELEKAIQQAVNKHEGRVLTLEMLPEAIASVATKKDVSGNDPLRGIAVAGSIKPLWKTEREEIEKALKLCDGNVLHAARLLEVSPSTIYRKQQTWKARQS